MELLIINVASSDVCEISEKFLHGYQIKFARTVHFFLDRKVDAILYTLKIAITILWSKNSLVRDRVRNRVRDRVRNRVLLPVSSFVRFSCVVYNNIKHDS